MLVQSPLSADTEKEVGTSNEDINEAVLSDVVKAINARVKRIDREHNPFRRRLLARWREDLHRSPHAESARLGGKRVATDRFLIVHEAVEKALLDELGLHYLHAHQIALRIERASVEAAGYSWAEYNRFTKANEKKIQDERLTNVPDDLDLTPYRNERDFQKLRQMIAAERPEA